MDHGSRAQDLTHRPLRPLPAARERLAAAVREHGSPGAAGVAAGLPVLPAEEGLEPVRPLGGEVWLVRERRSGEHFVLRLCCGRTPPELERAWAGARSLVADLAGREDPHVVAVRGLLGPAARPVGVVEDYLAGGSLADRLAGPVRPDPAELVPVLRDAAAGLAALHRRGRAHGALSSRRILFRDPWPGGTTEASNEPPPAALSPGSTEGSPEEDVRELAVVAWEALTGRAPAQGPHRVPLTVLRPGAPRALLLAVEEALAEDPSDRPTAAELAARLARPAEEIAGAAGGGAGRASAARGPGHRRRTILLTAAAALLLPVAAGSGTGAPEDPGAGRVPGRSGAAPAVPTPASLQHRSAPDDGPRPDDGPVANGAASAEDPRAALRELVARRGTALRTGEVRLLEQVYVPGAGSAAADRRLLERAAEDGGEAFAELELSVGRVLGRAPGEASGAGTAAFVVQVHVDGYPGGPGSAPGVAAAGDGAWVQTVEVVMVRTDRGWRLRSVAPVAAGGEAGKPPGPAGA